MNVALCFSGKLGEWHESRDSIVENIINPLKPDIFLSTWIDEDYLDFINFYNAKKFICKEYKLSIKEVDFSKFDCEPSAGLIPMLLNMYYVNKIKNDYEKTNNIKYDLVIRLRPDIQVLEQIKPHEIKDCIQSRCIRLPFFESDNIYDHEEELKKEFSFSFIYDKASLPDQINDQIAIGPTEEMNKYMTCVKNIEQTINYMWQDGYPEYMIKVPESVFTLQLQRKNCRYKKLTGTNSFGNIKTLLCKDGIKWRNKGHNSIQYN